MAEQITYQALLELNQLFRMSGTSSSGSPIITRALAKLIRAFHLEKIIRPEVRAEFFSVLAEFLNHLKSNLSMVVDVLRVGSKSFVNEVGDIFTQNAKSS